MRIVPALLLSAAALSLAGCAHPIGAPSLMPRAVEKQPIDMPVSEPVERESPADPVLQAALAKQVAAAEAGDKDFMAQRDIAEKAVAAAAGTAQGSEAWVQAQEAITALEPSRMAVRDAASAIEALRDDPAHASTGNRAAIDAAAARVNEIGRAETEKVTALSAKLG